MGTGGGYAIVFFAEGDFVNNDDGGFINWCYTGNPECIDDGKNRSKLLRFERKPYTL